jgi:divalent metal cation (Fe/Co/Zn/Cd) transporter
MSDVRTHIRRLQWFSIFWMSVELAVALTAGIRAHSVALTAFGADSLIELVSAAAVLFAMHAKFKRTATQVTAWMLVALAVFILANGSAALLLPGLRPQASLVGIILLMATAIVMPLLARAKQRLARGSNNAEFGAALKQDAVQSSACAYLSWIALAGLLLNRILGWYWADVAASLLLLPFILREAREAFRGNQCCC